MTEASQPEAMSRSNAYRLWVLALVFLMMTSNYIDRSIVNILAQPIKEEFHLSDLQVGLLGGFAFALLYMFMGIPIARLAERRNRVNIVTAAITVWSLMTALCGLATSYWQLLLFRVGVGVGEAGASPPSQSLIADYFPPEKRASALAIHSFGIPIGTLGGAVLGGLIAQEYGWRVAFTMVGAPGLLLALLFRLTVAEPKRGAQDTAQVRARLETVAAPTLLSGAAQLFRRPTFVAICVGMALTQFGLQGIGIFKAALILRRFDVSLAEVGLILGLVTGAGAGIGTLIGGFLSDAVARWDRRWYVWLPALGLVVTGPFYAVALVQPTWHLTALFLLLPGATSLIFVAPILATVQNLAEPRMRATATALLTLVGTLFGLALGPVVAGVISDRLAGRAFGDAAVFADVCPGGVALASAEAAVKASCRAASAAGIQHSSLFFCGFFFLAAIAFLVPARSIRRDLLYQPPLSSTAAGPLS